LRLLPQSVGGDKLPGVDTMMNEFDNLYGPPKPPAAAGMGGMGMGGASIGGMGMGGMGAPMVGMGGMGAAGGGVSAGIMGALGE
jgi:hypothetical protein